LVLNIGVKVSVGESARRTSGLFNTGGSVIFPEVSFTFITLITGGTMTTQTLGVT
jgi:hypothetical protein